MSHRGLKQRKVGREPNDLCPCGSGKKYKKCCGANTASRKGPKDRIPPAFKDVPIAYVDPATLPFALSKMMYDLEKYTPEERVRLDAQRRLQFR